MGLDFSKTSTQQVDVSSQEEAQHELIVQQYDNGEIGRAHV